MVKKIIICFVVAASITAIFTLVNTGHSVKSNKGKLVGSCPAINGFVGYCAYFEPPCQYVVSYNGFPIHDGQVNQSGDTSCTNNNGHTYSVLGIIENLVIWFLITFGLIEGYSLVRKRLSVGKTNQTIKK